MADAAAPGSTQLRNQLEQIPTQHLEEYVNQAASHPAANPEHPQHRAWAAEYGPLARIITSGERLPAFGGDFQPGLYKPPPRKFANPAPLGLSGFALTTFVLSMINLNARGIMEPNIVVGPAFAYGGLVQLLAGMWEFPQNNVFGATALSTYGGFWISIGIILTPGGFGIAEAYGGQTHDFYVAFGLYIIAWFIYTFLIWLCTLKSTVAFCSLFFTVWLAFLMLGLGYIDNVDGVPNVKLINAGGGFGIVAGFIAWWNMLAGIADRSNSFFLVPVLRFPWSEAARLARKETDAEKAD